MPKLVLMRHGESLWNKENRFTGFKDVPLSEKGEEEAIAGGEKMEAAGMINDEGENIFGGIFTSTLERAIYTTELALNIRRDNFIMEPDLRERDYGDLTGLNKAETAKKFGDEQVRIWRRSYDVPPPNGESLKDVVNRVRPYYDRKIKPVLLEGKNVFIGAHGNTLRAMLIILGLRTPENINEAEIPTGAPLVMEVDAKGAVTKEYYL
ncbi:MAG: 2,3-diphosphoglycerate-dependent phosphoglycerate mutase [Rhodospirillales bacterium]|nr:2,3-diphosphoglycerate-dependent phosphoglycerate mutase [Alphaproteobacteria bacterium]MCB9987460.1 2,3-diphosphoglycerate-dependent phosphoglycerate mutase [Rhodospirillales bacterium]USO07561.1 MAG: 2,3-diphosphoglycerate-dependent phosphoglycerate mutase [Rhodospirillales bacterium]